MLALMLQRAGAMDTGGNSIIHWVVLFIAIIIGGGLLIWAVQLAIANFVPDPWKAKVSAFFYIVIAILLAVLVFHWAGLF
jgi:hypothetical protein